MKYSRSRNWQRRLKRWRWPWATRAFYSQAEQRAFELRLSAMRSQGAAAMIISKVAYGIR